jgi:hypothetical protein
MQKMHPKSIFNILSQIIVVVKITILARKKAGPFGGPAELEVKFPEPWRFARKAFHPGAL